MRDMYLSKESFLVDIDNQTKDVPFEKGAKQSTFMPEGVLLEYEFEDARTMVEAMRRGQKVSNNGQCLGWRESDSDYKWMTFSEVLERAENISYGLLQIGMRPGQETFVGIYSQNRPEWYLVEHACHLQSAVMVPLYDTLGPAASTFILNNVEAEFMFCDTEKRVKSILEAKNDIPKLQHIITINEVSEDVQNLADQKKVLLHRLGNIEKLGKENPISLQLPKPSDLAIICFTSGTTGEPKGVMITHGNVIANCSGFAIHYGKTYFFGDSILSYLPMAHILAVSAQLTVLMTGGRVGFYRGDIKLIGEDLQALKPTLLPVVPRVLNKVYDKVQNEIKSSTLKKLLLGTALGAKKAELKRGIIRNNSIWDRLVLKNIRNALGGNLRLIVTSGAPIRDEVLTFFRCAMGCPVVQAYGQTECSAGATCTVLGDFSNGTVGAPLACNFVKLEDVPDMGYFAENGEGEVLLKGPSVTKGYYKDPTKTAEILDADGWMHTGDIGKWLSNGSLSIIDRKKNLLKLSQGEYVSPEKIENVYLGSPFIEQMYVHGSSLESSLIAIVVPEKEALMSWCSKEGIKGDWKRICEDEHVKASILKELHHFGKAAGLNSLEQVKAIHLHNDVFTVENGILTATMKVKRGECQRIFKDVLQKMYEDMR